MKKIAVVFAALALCSSAFAEVSYRFYNKTFSDTIKIRHVDDDYAKAEVDPAINFKGRTDGDSYGDFNFLGIYNRVYAEIKTDKTDAMIKATFGFDDWNDDNDFGFRWTGYVDDWYVEYRPWNFLTFGFHDAIYMGGSYLPIYDDNLYSGNIGSEGVTVVFRPTALNNALRIAATTPFTTRTNWLYADKDVVVKKWDPDTGKWVETTAGETDVDDKKLNVGFGAIYSVKYFEVGVSIQDVFDNDERRIGAYVNFPGLFGAANEKISIGGGFAYSENGSVRNFDNTNTFDDYTYYGGVNGKRLTNAYFTYDGDKFDVKAEAVYNFGEKYYGWDLYTAASIQFWLLSKLSATGIARIIYDNEHPSGGKLDNIYSAEFQLKYIINKHMEVQAAARTDFFDKNYTICFPAYWKYTF